MSWIFLIPLAVLILSAIVKAFSTTSSQSLNKKFVSLGILKGKTYNQITSVVGEPNSKTRISGGYIYQWSQPAYHIALIFDERLICLGVSNEIKVDESMI